MADDVKVPEIKGPFRTPQALNEALKAARDKGFVVLSPLFYVSRILPHHAVDLRLVLLDAADPKNSDDVWRLSDDEEGGGSGDEVILTRVANDKIAAAGGVHWVPSQCGRLDDHSDPYYVLYRMTGQVQDFDGVWRPVVGDRELDYRDGSAMIKSRGKDWSPARLTRARKSINALAVSMAANNAIRRAFSMPSSFPLGQVRKFFVVPKLVIDSEAEWVQRMLVERSLSASASLYGAPKAPGQTAPPLPENQEPQLDRRPPPPLTQAPPPPNGDDQRGLVDADDIPF